MVRGRDTTGTSMEKNKSKIRGEISKMKTAEIKKMTVTQLEKELINFKKEQYNLRFQKVNSQVQNTSRVKIVRRSIAKILTFLNQKKRDN